jgi:hypothetical protein
VRRSDSVLSWDEAQTECRQQSAHLLIFTDAFYSPYVDTESAEVDGVGLIRNQLQKFINETGQYIGQLTMQSPASRKFVT